MGFTFDRFSYLIWNTCFQNVLFVYVMKLLKKVTFVDRIHLYFYNYITSFVNIFESLSYASWASLFSFQNDRISKNHRFFGVNLCF